jgi:23S rRNA (guanine745-N1)-methyltransferase
MRILDVGCGEGYYCRQLDALSDHPESLDLHGIDIAKVKVMLVSAIIAF